MNSLGMIASGIAHELNGPLATLKACSQGLLKRLQKEEIDRTLFKEYLEIMEEEIGRCMYITNNVLRFIQQEKGSYDQDIDIHASLDKTIDMVRLQGRCGERTVVRNYEKSGLIVLGNECELRQAFLSIIINALDIMQADDTLTLETRGDNSSALIFINNTGEPISRRKLDKDFRPLLYDQGETGRNGIGLFLANNIIKERGGEIRVASNEVEGTTFTIALPRYVKGYQTFSSLGTCQTSILATRASTTVAAHDQIFPAIRTRAARRLYLNLIILLDLLFQNSLRPYRQTLIS